jgi:hypothetical protein
MMTEPNSEYFFIGIKGSSIVNIDSNVELNNGIFVSFTNEGGKKFSVQVSELNEFIKIFKEHNHEISEDIISHDKYVDRNTPWTFQEKPYRALAPKHFPLAKFSTINPLIGSQTKGIFNAINAYICFLIGKEVVDDKFEFESTSLDSALDIIQQHTNAFSNKIPTNSDNLLGPFDSLKIAALESLYYFYINDTDKFLDNIITDEYKANTKYQGVYLWATQRGLDEKQLDSRVFSDKPFIFYGNKYFLSDQWTFESTNGRSIKDINDFLNIFGCKIIKYQNKYFLNKHNKYNKVSATSIPKPFLLLAGISGTGKTRFVREQAEASAGQYGVENRENYCLVPVRPDWHEPSDLLGYISRIGEGGARYIVTDLLRFIVAAWKHTTESASSGGVVYKPFETVSPFWLCLDEMNLAPVEQYFADYLSILETRKWGDGDYTCDPFLKKDVIDTLKEDGKAQFWSDLKIADDSGLIEYFSNYGIPLPPNLIVAGTVNMDETTHGFSRKVIDRALTLDFGEFYPNDYNEFFKQTILPKTLGFPVLSQVKQDSLPEEHIKETIDFLKAVNAVLVGSPFELAYRALNEALLAVACFKPAKPDELQAVWDDFLMMKVLPRIEGDAEKLGFVDESSLLTKLAGCLETLLPDIWDTARPDQLREYVLKGPILLTKCRSKHKLAWMQKRLADNGFTTFWP